MGWMDQVQTLAIERGAHLARTVVLLPYANLLAPARQMWASKFPSGFAPRFETTRNWAAELTLFTPGADDLCGQHGRDWLTAQTLLERAGLRGEAARLAGVLLEQAQQLVPLAAACPPARRGEWLAQAHAVLPGANDGALALEAALARTAAAWVGTSGYATDVLFDERTGRSLDALFIVPGLQADALADALAAHWAAKAQVLAPLAAPPQGRVALHAAQDAEDEAERACACVLRHLTAGRTPVALVATDRLLQRRINALLATRGVRAGELLADETGWKLSTTHAAAALMALLRACAPQASTDAVLDAIKLAPAWAAIDHRALERRLRKGAVRGWRRAALLAQGDALVEQVQLLRERMAASRTLADWLQATRVLLEDCGLWNQLAADEAGGELIAALGLSDETFADWRAWPQSARRMTLAEFTHWLREALEGASFRQHHSGQAQVVVLPLAQLLGRSFAALVLPGADEQHLPAAPEPAGVWTAAQRRALGLPTREALQQAQAAAWALAIAVPEVDVLWRQADDSGEPVLASPLVGALRLAVPAALHAGQDARVPQTVAAAPTPRPLPVGAQLPAQPLSASSYAQLRDCPYRFYALRQLGLQDEGELDVDLDKSDWGTWLHATLRAFHEALQQRPDADRHALIEQAATEVTQSLGLVQDDGEFLPFEAAWPELRDRYLRWLDAHEQQGYTFDRGEVDFNEQRGPVRLRGRIDRIDHAGAGTTLLIDYKTESQDKTKARTKPGSEDVQLPFYALLSGDEAPRAAYLNLTEREQPTLFELADIEQRAADLHAGMAEDLRRIAEGAPLPALGEGSVCDWCEVRGLCRKDSWSA